MSFSPKFFFIPIKEMSKNNQIKMPYLWVSIFEQLFIVSYASFIIIWGLFFLFQFIQRFNVQIQILDKEDQDNVHDKRKAIEKCWKLHNIPWQQLVWILNAITTSIIISVNEKLHTVSFKNVSEEGVMKCHVTGIWYNWHQKGNRKPMVQVIGQLTQLFQT